MRSRFGKESCAKMTLQTAVKHKKIMTVIIIIIKNINNNSDNNNSNDAVNNNKETNDSKKVLCTCWRRARESLVPASHLAP